MKTMGKLEKGFVKIVEIILAIAFAAMIIVVAVQVLARYVLPGAATWTDEVVRMLLAYVTFLGAVALYAGRGHIAVTNFIDMAPKPLRRVMLILCYLAQIAFCGIVIYAGFAYLPVVQARNTTVLHISFVVLYAIIPITGILTLVFVIRDFILEGILGRKFESESEIVKTAIEDVNETKEELL